MLIQKIKSVYPIVTTIEEARINWKEVPLNNAEDLANKKFNNWTPLYRTENNGRTTMWVCQCDCGNITVVRAIHLKSGRSRQCGNCKIDQSIIDLTGQRFGRLLVLNMTGNRRNSSVEWHCKCDCGNYIDISSISLRNGTTQSCGCYQKEKLKEAIEQKTIDITNQRFGRLIALYPVYVNNNQRKWHCICDCGNETDVNLQALRSGATQSCGCFAKEQTAKRNHELLQDLTDQKFGEWTVLSWDKETSKKMKTTYWLCKCSCGTIKPVEASSLKNGHSVSCGCKKCYSKGENVIKSLLQEASISFEPYKWFDNCRFPKTNYVAYFDFYVNNQYIIEYDGKQHFDKNNNYHTEETHPHDLIKNKYCFDNNIPLIRIPYDAKYTIDDLKLETTRFLLTPENEQAYYESRK